MFLLLLHTMRLTHTFTDSDTYYLLCDEVSRAHLEKATLCKGITFITIPKPTTHLSGMLYKYKLHTLVNIQNKDCCYLDVDLLSTRSIKIFPRPDTLLVLPEGRKDDSNYCPDNCELDVPYGCSAGFFAFNFGSKVKAFFERVIQYAEEDKKQYYTIEQVFFNKALRMKEITIMEPHIVSFNANNYIDKCFFISYAGEPGDGKFHWEKGSALYYKLCGGTIDSKKRQKTS